MSESRLPRKNVAKTTNISADELKQAVLKYNSRQAKSGKSFSLVSVELVNYESLVERAGQEAADQIMHGLRGTLSRICREADRLAALSPGLLLMLLPETDGKQLQEISLQLKETLSTAARTATQLRPSFRLRSCESTERGGDLEHVLNAVGCELDEHGSLARKTIAAATSELASVESWLERYDCQVETGKRRQCDKLVLVEQAATDRWSNRQVRIIEVTNGGHATTDTLDEWIKRAKVLQSVDHPGMQPISDFFLDRENHLLLSLENAAGDPFFEQAVKHKLAPEVLADAAMQFLSILVYAEGLIPHMVVDYKPQRLRYLPNEPRLLLCDYQSDYVLAKAQEEGTELRNACAFHQFTQALILLCPDCEQVAELDRIAQKAALPAAPRDLNTIHKLRAAAKKLTSTGFQPGRGGAKHA